MKIRDLNGCPIGVTNLNKDSTMAGQYKKYRHKDKSFSDFDKRQKTNWADMYEKLRAIKELLDDN